jgi:hypothetical protein
MLEGQIEEHPLDRGQGRVEPAIDGGAGVPARMRVSGEGLGRAAEDVARQLIQQDDQRQGAARRRGPDVVAAGAGVAHGGGEAGARGVEVGGLFKPLLPACGGIALEPEIQNFGWSRCHGNARSSSRTEWIASRPDRSRI